MILASFHTADATCNDMLLISTRKLKSCACDSSALTTSLFLRSELYQGPADAVCNGDPQGASIEKKIVLPSSFTGSPKSGAGKAIFYNTLRRFGEEIVQALFQVRVPFTELELLTEGSLNISGGFAIHSATDAPSFSRKCAEARSGCLISAQLLVVLCVALLVPTSLAMPVEQDEVILYFSLWQFSSTSGCSVCRSSRVHIIGHAS
ncbi:DNA helicase pif1, ATP-dependent [Plakobranchus ocellatus]|uniref:DNA helicase pif1, ATP-dependent n=1 Tax=Plakobranchus ocellatus TaxID=259542 RepID=A0AAV4CNT7_9GAST|nr:DNA helicase pif1, ATP-dependent [Plakobranchus ocellatus]